MGFWANLLPGSVGVREIATPDAQYQYPPVTSPSPSPRSLQREAFVHSQPSPLGLRPATSAGPASPSHPSNVKLARPFPAEPDILPQMILPNLAGDEDDKRSTKRGRSFSLSRRKHKDKTKAELPPPPPQSREPKMSRTDRKIQKEEEQRRLNIRQTEIQAEAHRAEMAKEKHRINAMREEQEHTRRTEAARMAQIQAEQKAQDDAKKAEVERKLKAFEDEDVAEDEERKLSGLHRHKPGDDAKRAKEEAKRAEEQRKIDQKEAEKEAKRSEELRKAQAKRDEIKAKEDARKAESQAKRDVVKAKDKAKENARQAEIQARRDEIRAKEEAKRAEEQRKIQAKEDEKRAREEAKKAKELAVIKAKEEEQKAAEDARRAREAAKKAKEDEKRAKQDEKEATKEEKLQLKQEEKRAKIEARKSIDEERRAKFEARKSMDDARSIMSESGRSRKSMDGRRRLQKRPPSSAGDRPPSRARSLSRVSLSRQSIDRPGSSLGGDAPPVPRLSLSSPNPPVLPPIAPLLPLIEVDRESGDWSEGIIPGMAVTTDQPIKVAPTPVRKFDFDNPNRHQHRVSDITPFHRKLSQSFPHTSNPLAAHPTERTHGERQRSWMAPPTEAPTRAPPPPPTGIVRAAEVQRPKTAAGNEHHKSNHFATLSLNAFGPGNGHNAVQAANTLRSRRSLLDMDSDLPMLFPLPPAPGLVQDGEITPTSSSANTHSRSGSHEQSRNGHPDSPSNRRDHLAKPRLGVQHRGPQMNSAAFAPEQTVKRPWANNVNGPVASAAPVLANPEDGTNSFDLLREEQEKEWGKLKKLMEGNGKKGKERDAFGARIRGSDDEEERLRQFDFSNAQAFAAFDFNVDPKI